MLIPRVIPCLLLQGKGLVKGAYYKNHRYIGDPLNAIRIFNTKEVDELVVLDIAATPQNRSIDREFVKMIATECMMPLTVGGGITTVDEAGKIFSAGAEKIVLNSAALENPNLMADISKKFGCQSLAVSIDVRTNWRKKYEVYTHCGTKKASFNPLEAAKLIEGNGAGEIFLNSIDKEGTMSGYDIELLQQVVQSVKIPVIASGGAGKIEDFRAAINDGLAAGVSAGSFFVFHGPRRAVLISYPERILLEKVFCN